MDKKNIEDLLVKQQMMLEELQTKVNSMYRFFIINWVIGILKILMFVVLPIILSIIYLLPLFGRFVDFYASNIGLLQSGGIDIQSILQ